MVDSTFLILLLRLDSLRLHPSFPLPLSTGRYETISASPGKIWTLPRPTPDFRLKTQNSTLLTHRRECIESDDQRSSQIVVCRRRCIRPSDKGTAARTGIRARD